MSVEGRTIRHAVEVRHDSFRSPDFVALLREYGVAVITAADSEYTQIADVTAPFVYARIMGTQRGRTELAIPISDLDEWAERARIWAEGGVPDGLDTVGPGKPDKAGATSSSMSSAATRCAIRPRRWR